MKNLTFDEWFKELVTFAIEREESSLIDASNPEAYMEYYDDGDTPEDTFDAEFEARAEEDSEN